MRERIQGQNHYEVLGLPWSESARKDLQEKDIKLAYHRALLLHHPDKSNLAHTSKSKYSVDQITAAYKTIINPVARAEYDKVRTLKLATTTAVLQAPHPGLETVDLDDLSFDGLQGVWYRSCQCGKEQAYTMSQEDLESNAEHGELTTGCQGCSLWLRVTFAVAEDDSG